MSLHKHDSPASGCAPTLSLLQGVFCPLCRTVSGTPCIHDRQSKPCRPGQPVLHNSLRSPSRSLRQVHFSIRPVHFFEGINPLSQYRRSTFKYTVQNLWFLQDPEGVVHLTPGLPFKPYLQPRFVTISMFQKEVCSVPVRPCIRQRKRQGSLRKDSAFQGL